MRSLGGIQRCAKSFGRNPKPEPRSAFTLLELLAVIAIIALIAALLLPAMSRAKDSAFSTTCRNNLHQIGLAAQMYLADFRRYPINWEVSVTDWVSDGTVIESGSLMPYLSQNHKVFYCPVQEDCPIRRTPIAGDDRLSGYALNQDGTSNSSQIQDLHLGLGLGSPPMEINEEAVRCPADMIAYGDVFTGAFDLSPHGTNRFSWSGLTALAMGMPSARHLGGANALFCDGHVEFHNQAEWIKATDTARSRWNNDNEPHYETW